MATQNLPATAKAETIRQLFEKSEVKKQLQLAIPKHMTVDRLLRVAMTAIRVNPKLMDCTQQSLLACVMGCATLGLEPEPFLGQAYMVPFKNDKKGGILEAQLIPGYRGYLTLARRSGEVQSISAQVVYERDQFSFQYGLNERLDHVPADGDRGELKGAYVVFRYKDGSHSFDYMGKKDIDKIRERSKASGSGPWVTDYPEMAKKTVIRRHIKLAPLSVEMFKAAALEEKFNAGESQFDLLLSGDNGVTGPTIDHQVDFDAMAMTRLDNNPAGKQLLDEFLRLTAKGNLTDDGVSTTVEAIKEYACKDFESFWQSFEKWWAKQGQEKLDKRRKGRPIKTAPMPESSPAQEPPKTTLPEKEIDLNKEVSCPDTGEVCTGNYCQGCMKLVDCEAW